MLFTYSVRNEPNMSTTTTVNLSLNTKATPPTIFDGIRNLHYIAQSTRSGGCSSCR